MSKFTNCYCIISYIDLINIRKLLKTNSAAAVKLMCEVHEIVLNSCRNFLHHPEICFWNDSVLLYAPLQSSTQGHLEVMKEVQSLKGAIDTKSPSYAICVQGRSFFPPENSANVPVHLHFLKASSLAFANCFEIDKKLGPKFKKNWYIDSRIQKRIHIDAVAMKELIPMWPTMKKRTIFMYDAIRFIS